MTNLDAVVQLVPTQAADLDFVLACEGSPAARPFVVQWSRARHLAALDDPDCVHRVILAGAAAERAGYVLIFGVQSPHHSVELRRIVCVAPGRGFGAAALRAVQELAFHQLQAHRLWLDLKPHNARAHALYLAAGFRDEGILRDSVLGPEGYESMLVMSQLHPEFLAGEASRVASGPQHAPGSRSR